MTPTIRETETGDVVELLDAYWNAAYDQGWERGQHDSIDGRAQKAEDAIKQAFTALRLELEASRERTLLATYRADNLHADLEKVREEVEAIREAYDQERRMREFAEERCLVERATVSETWRLSPALEGYETNFNNQTITLRFVSEEEFHYASLALNRLVEMPDLPLFASEVRAQTLEEAASIADSHFLAEFIDGHDEERHQAVINARNKLARQIAAEIRALTSEAKEG